MQNCPNHDKQLNNEKLICLPNQIEKEVVDENIRQELPKPHEQLGPSLTSKFIPPV